MVASGLLSPLHCDETPPCGQQSIHVLSSMYVETLAMTMRDDRVSSMVSGLRVTSENIVAVHDSVLNHSLCNSSLDDSEPQAIKPEYSTGEDYHACTSSTTTCTALPSHSPKQDPSQASPHPRPSDTLPQNRLRRHSPNRSLQDKIPSS